jgi:hypothetical protein
MIRFNPATRTGYSLSLALLALCKYIEGSGQAAFREPPGL